VCSKLGKIKYLKDNEDDCDLDPEQLVSDLLVDEGKAARDGSDQHVTIKVIQEEGHALREGSVIPDLTPAHFQPPARPPVPKFSDIESSLGKRPHGFEEGQGAHDATPGNKRIRPLEIQETQEQDEVVGSIERDVPLGSPELVQNTPSLPLHVIQTPGRPVGQAKTEAPDFLRPRHDILPATADELEDLSAAPVAFTLGHQHPAKRKRVSAFGTDQPERNGVVFSRRVELPGELGRSQAPMTPPSDIPRNVSASVNAHLNNSNRGAKSPAPQTSASSNKFKFPPRRNVYDFPESDIDDSQMSPHPKETNVAPHRLRESTSVNERLPAREERPAVNGGLSLNEAESDVHDVLGPSRQTLNGAVPSERHAQTDEESSDDVYEDAEMMNGSDGHDVMGFSPATSRPDSQLERVIVDLSQSIRRSDMVQHAQERGENASSISPAHRVGTPSPPDSSAPAASAPTVVETSSKHHADVRDGKHAEAGSDIPGGPRHGRKVRPRKRAKRQSGLDDNAADHSIASGAPGDYSQPEAERERSTPTRSQSRPTTPSLDSPGEQLSQSLQASAQKPVSTAALEKKSAKTPEMNGVTKPLKDSAKRTSKKQSGKADHQTGSKGHPEVSRAHSPPDGSHVPGRSQDKGSKEKQTPKAATKAKEKKAQAIHDAEPTSSRAVSKGKAVKSGQSPEDKQTSGDKVRDVNPLGSRDQVQQPAVPDLAADPKSESNRPAAAATGGPLDSASNSPKDGEPKKSLSIPPGFTEEEYEIMKSRQGMTKEQYEAEKKKRKAEAQRKAAEKKKQEAAAKRPEKKRTSVGAKSGQNEFDATVDGEQRKSQTPTLTVSFSESITATSKPATKAVDNGSDLRVTGIPSSVDVRSETSTTDLAAKQTTGDQQKVSESGHRPPSVSSQATKSQAGTSVKTLAKAATKSPSVASSTPSRSTQTKQRVSTVPSRVVSHSSTPRPVTLKPATQPTISTAKGLKELRLAMKAHEASSASTPVHTPKPTRRAFDESTDDESESSSSSESDTDGRETDANNQPRSTAKKTGTFTVARPDPTIRDQSISDSSDDEEDDEL